MFIIGLKIELLNLLNWQKNDAYIILSLNLR